MCHQGRFSRKGPSEREIHLRIYARSARASPMTLREDGVQARRTSKRNSVGHRGQRTAIRTEF
jgi:hypothetical protein